MCITRTSESITMGVIPKFAWVSGRITRIGPAVLPEKKGRALAGRTRLPALDTSFGLWGRGDLTESLILPELR